ncbi:MAG: FecR family protein [Telluria sp.]|nr:FecR family protein [Telluria sp.]
MSQPKKCTAIKALLALALLFVAGLACAAQVAGTVVHLSGPLLSKKADGSVKVLAVKSEVEQGDTLVSQKNTYAQIKFIDNSEITLRPGTTFTIESFAFDSDKPDADSASFNLVKGGLRSITGLLGKRNKEKFALKTPTATIGIRGTTFIAEFVEAEPEALASMNAYLLASTAGMVGSAPPLQPLQLAQLAPPGAPKAPGLAPGLYVHVIDGLISLSNKGGTQNFAAGQFGYTRNVIQPPVIVPRNPGLQFTPPPTFNAPAGRTSGSGSNAAATIDCEVR